MSSIFCRRNYSICAVYPLIAINIGTTLVSSATKREWEVAVFTTKTNVKIEGWRRSGWSPNCFETRKCLFIIGTKSEEHCILVTDKAPSPLCISTMSGTIVHLQKVKLAISSIFYAKLYKSQIYSFAFSYRSKSPNLESQS